MPPKNNFFFFCSTLPDILSMACGNRGLVMDLVCILGNNNGKNTRANSLHTVPYEIFCLKCSLQKNHREDTNDNFLLFAT